MQTLENNLIIQVDPISTGRLCRVFTPSSLSIFGRTPRV